MKKNTLKVQPARKVYRPAYPSHADKNPLLYPETRPYPFSQRFIDWAAKGGLAGLVLFGGADLTAQTQTDSLYNPFPLENAHLPYWPSSFGTGMPERIGSGEAAKVIRQTFADEGIILEDYVFFEKGEVKVILDGYSEKDKIGFILVENYDMGSSFRHKNSNLPHTDLWKIDFKLTKEKEFFEERVSGEFQRFIKNKDEFIRRETFKKNQPHQLKFIEGLRILSAENHSEKDFQMLFIERTLGDLRSKWKNGSNFSNEISTSLDERFDASVEKIVLLQKAKNFDTNEYSPYGKAFIEQFRKFKTIKSDKEFVRHYLHLSAFHNYNMGIHWSDEVFQGLKTQIMQSYPIKKWRENTQILEEYHNKRTITLSEVRRIDKKNKKGKQLIAPIFMRDAKMTIQKTWDKKPPEEWNAEKVALEKEFNHRNGMTDEILAAKKEALNEVNRKYGWHTMSKLEKPARDSMLQIKKFATQKVNDTYLAMEKLTEKEKAEYKAKFDAFKQRTNDFYRKNEEEAKIQTLRNLEKEVKIYIKWAQSQMGG